MAQRVKDSADYLENLNRQTPLLRQPRGSLIIAPSPAQVKGILRFQQSLQEQGQLLSPLSPQQVQEKYGFLPRQGLAMMEKKHDFIFEADFLERMVQALKSQGGQVENQWRLQRVFVSPNKNQGGIIELLEVGANQEKKLHYRTFSKLHLSLGATPYFPNIYDLISVTGVSMNVLVLGAAFQGGPLVCGGANHLVPLLEPRSVTLGNKLIPVSFVRLSTGGCVNPLDRGDRWYHYDGNHALHLLHQVQATLPQEFELKILSVLGCNRVIGKDGRQIEIPLNDHITIQIGAGGGGLTQMGAVPQRMRK